jgi:phospholipid-binding lipoprotein MlaA
MNPCPTSTGGLVFPARRRALASLFALALAIFSFAPASAQTAISPVTVADEPDEFATPQISDPFTGINHAIFRFNDGVYDLALRPFAHTYERVVPKPVQHGLTNFFTNLKFPVRFVSSVFQAKPKRAALETGKFVINSIWGLAGFMRASDSIPALTGVPGEDLGQTFGVWGMGPGPYLVIPVLGPSTLRDFVGFIGDAELSPINWLAIVPDSRYDTVWRATAQMIDVVNTLPGTVRTYDSLHDAAVDPYVSMRNGYIQYRAAAVKK